MGASRLVFAVSVAASLTACTSVAVGKPGPMVPGDTPGTRLPRPGTAGTGGTASNTMRYVCRNSVSSGWIAIDYIDDPEGCSTSRARYGVAVIVPLTGTNVGGTLEVCADERIPANWHDIGVIAGDARCPSTKPTAEPGKATVRQIRRDR